MQDISLHILDIVENCVAAGATGIKICIIEDSENDKLSIDIQDNGRGMDEATVKKALDPFYTSKPGKRVGLGIPLLAQAAREGGGKFEINSKPDSGTRITATFVLSHPDRKPLGEVDSTIQMMQLAHPKISFEYTYTRK